MRLTDVRPEVAAFALLMEEKLRENDHKRPWKRESTTYLSRRCGNELKELRVAIAELRANQRIEMRTQLRLAVSREAADVANFAMFIADVCGGLQVAGTTTGTKETP